jgi:hypothetical protein
LRICHILGFATAQRRRYQLMRKRIIQNELDARLRMM